jgi:hypothetical protein
MSHLSKLRAAERRANELLDMGYEWDEAITEAAKANDVEPGDLEWSLENPPEPDYDTDWWELARHIVYDEGADR